MLSGGCVCLEATSIGFTPGGATWLVLWATGGRAQSQRSPRCLAEALHSVPLLGLGCAAPGEVLRLGQVKERSIRGKRRRG